MNGGRLHLHPEVTLETVKSEVKTIHKILKKDGSDLRISNVYHKYAQQYGYENWHVLSALLKRKSGDQ
jgi:hypothetical protein